MRTLKKIIIYCQTVIAPSSQQRILLLVLQGFIMLACNRISGQIQSITYHQDKDTVLNYDAKNKIGILVFHRKTELSEPADTRFLDSLIELEKPYSGFHRDIFCVYLINTIEAPKENGICIRIGDLSVNGANIPHNDFTINDFVILIDTTSILYQMELKKKGIPRSLFHHKSSETNPFTRLTVKSYLINLIVNPEYNWSAQNRYLDNLKTSIIQYQDSVQILTQRIKEINEKDSIYKEVRAFYLGLSTGINLIAGSKIQSSSIGTKFLNGYSFCANLEQYGLLRKRRLGIGYHLGIATSIIEVFNRTRITDTVEYNAIDDDGEAYVRIAYGDKIREINQFWYSQMGFTICYRLPLSSHFNNGYIRVGCGFSLNSIITNVSRAISGTIVYGGRYKNYGTDTMFSTTNGFGIEAPINKTRESIKTFTAMPAFISSIDVFYPISMDNNVIIGLGVQTNSFFVRTPSTTDLSVLSKDNRTYNSLLYRTEGVKLTSLQFCARLLLRL